MDATEEPMIRLLGVGKTYPDGTVAVESLSLDVPRGRTVCLVGPSGCGKSTTLKMVNRLIELTTGTITLDGEDVTHADPVSLRRRIGYVIQQVGLFPHQRIRANVATVPLLLGWDRKHANARAEELLGMVGLDPASYANRYPHQLSGGEQQRVGVARALAADPPVLLMDEPFGAVDPIVRGRLQDEFAHLARDLDKTVMFVTHDIDEAVRLGDKVAVFATGGRLAQYDVPAQILGAPADEFVAKFVGSSRGLRRLAVTVISSDDLIAPDGRQTPLTVPLGASLEEALAMMMRNDDAVVGVTDHDRLVGMLTPDAVHHALRRSVAESAPDAHTAGSDSESDSTPDLTH